MDNSESMESKAKSFQPLSVMGIFWMAFGVIVLFSSFFVRETARVPLIRGLLTNMIAGILLVAAGLFSWIRARRLTGAGKRKDDER